MRSRIFTGLLLLDCGVRAVAGVPQDMELTGLADGPIRVAFVKVQPGDQNLMLYPGKATAGITLKDLDVKGGWALLEQDTNRIKLRLAHYLTTTLGTAEVAPGSSSLASQFRLRQIQAAAAANSIDPSLTMPAFDGQSPSANRAESQSYPPQEAASAYAVVQPNQPEQLESSPSTSGSAVGNQPWDASSPGLPATQPGEGLRPVAVIADPEGDKIRGLFGTQAFLAWDLAHADRWNQNATQ